VAPFSRFGPKRELGDVSAQELSSFIERMQGVKIVARFIPIFVVSIKDKRRLEASRQAARAAAEQARTSRAALAGSLPQ